MIKKGSVFQLFIFLVFVMSLVMGCANGDNDDDDNQDIMSSRQDIWLKYLTETDDNHYHKYGLYVNRLMTVRHPEVYLLGDYQFLENVENLEMQPYYGWDATRYFSLERYDVNQNTIITSREFYPDEIDIFPYLDKRCLGAKALIWKSVFFDPVQQPYIKEIEKSVLTFCKRKMQDSAAEMYLLYAEDESAFLWLEEQFYSMYDGSPVSIDSIRAKNVILIFNDRFVWYPLMERDDREQDTTLDSLIIECTTADVLPILTPEEQSLIEHLRELSRLNSEEEILLAGYMAGKCNFAYGVFPEDAMWINSMLEKWQSVLPILKYDDLVSMLGWYCYGSISSLLTNQVILESNVLSPYTYHLASTLPEDFVAEDLQTLSKWYYHYDFSWGTIWELGLDNYSIDESGFSRSGACDIQALNIASILNLRGIENYFFQGYRSFYEYGHCLVYVPDYRIVFSNGIYLDDPAIFVPGYPNGLFYLAHLDGWAAFIQESFYGNVNPSEVADWLTFLQNEYGETIYGHSRQYGDTIDVPLDEFVGILNSQTYTDAAVHLTLP